MNPILQVLFAQALTGVCAHPNSSLNNTRQLATQALAIAQDGAALWEERYGRSAGTTPGAATQEARGQPVHAGK